MECQPGFLAPQFRIAHDYTSRDNLPSVTGYTMKNRLVVSLTQYGLVVVPLHETLQYGSMTTVAEDDVTAKPLLVVIKSNDL